jgi:adenosylmethionine-8-amino-7-oxononanoate aminotransferase
MVAEETATIAAISSTIIRIIEDLIVFLPPTAITEHAVLELFQTADTLLVRAVTLM